MLSPPCNDEFVESDRLRLVLVGQLFFSLILAGLENFLSGLSCTTGKFTYLNETTNRLCIVDGQSSQSNPKFMLTSFIFLSVIVRCCLLNQYILCLVHIFFEKNCITVPIMFCIFQLFTIFQNQNLVLLLFRSLLFCLFF